MDELVKKQQQEIIDTAKLRFKEAMDAESHLRDDAIEDIAFENGEQWDSKSLEDRAGRPCLTINKTAGTVKQILGEARKNRPRIKVRPVDSEADPQVAELLTGLIRNIENISDAEAAYDHGHDCSVRGGYGYWRIITEYASEDTFDQDILIKRITNQFSVYLDQSAQEPDYSDAQYCFVAETMTKEEFKSRYPKASVANIELGDGESEEGWYTDDEVRIAEYWYKEPVRKTLYLLDNGMTVDEEPEQVLIPVVDQMTGQPIIGTMQDVTPRVVRERTIETHKVMWCKITASEVIEGPQEWAGRYIPIVPCLGEEVWIEGKRYLRSAIKWAKDPQKLYNWSRSTAAETISLAPKQPWLLTPEMIEGHETQWQQAHVRPMPYLLYNENSVGVPQRNQASITDTGALNEAMQAADDLKATTGIFDASLGAQGNETSGIAIQRRQQQGNTASYIYTDNQQRALKYTGKILVDLIPKIYDTERVVRLLGNDGKEAWATINKEDPMTGRKINDLSVGKYDVVADVSAGYETKRLEAADGMSQMMNAVPQFAPIIMPRIAKNLDWPESDEIAEEVKQLSQPQQDPMAQQMAQMQMQFQQIMQQLETMQKKADIAETESKTMLNIAKVGGEKADTQKTVAETGKTTVDAAHKYYIGG